MTSAVLGRSGVLTLAGLGTTAIVLGAIFADDVPMTSDETHSWSIANRSAVEFLQVQRRQAVAMAPYHAGLWLWMQISTADWWVRMFSALGGALTVCLLFVLATRWMGHRIALVACVVTLVNPYFHRYLVDARTYSWLMAMGVATVILFDDLRRRDRPLDVVLLGVVVGIGMMSHVAFVIVVGSAVAALVITSSLTARLFKRLTVSAAIATVVFLPTAYLLLRRRDQLAQDSPATPSRVVALTSSALGSMPTSALLVVGIAALVVTALMRKQRDWPTVCLLCMAVGPPVLLALMTLVGDDIFASRYLAPMMPFAAFAAVAGFRSLWDARDGTYALAAVAVVGLVAGILGPSVRDFSQADAISASEFLDENVDGSDVVLFEPAFVRLYVSRYWGNRPEVDPMFVEDDRSRLYARTRPFRAVRAEVEQAATVWIVMLGSDSRFLDELRDDREVERHQFGDLKVVELAGTAG